MNKLFFLFFVVCGSFCVADANSGKATTVKLNDGRELPVLALGTWRNGTSSEVVQATVETAFAEGYRHIDTAASYNSEKEVGKGLQAKIADGTLKREDAFISTKLWNSKHAQDQVIPALRESLKNLELDYVDLYLIHWPVSFYENGSFNSLDYVKTWKGMEEAQKLGLVKSIGVSNFNENQLERLLESANIRPAVNQVEVNPNLTQKKLIAYCKNKGIQVVAYSPLGFMPESRSKNLDTPAPHLDDPILQGMGEKYKKNTVQIVLRYLIDSGLVPISRSITPLRIKQNIDVFDFQLTPEEVKTIDEFNLDSRVVSGDAWKDSPYYPFK